jgi:tetratricopeptide (TPR) repeat protein
MNADSQKENLLKILNSTQGMETPVDGPHKVKDDKFLNMWSMGLLTQEEHDQLIEHLALCKECRETVVTLVKTGALELPPLKETSRPASSPSGSSRRSFLKSVSWVAIVAAVVISVIVFMPKDSSDLSRVASLEKELEDGKVQSVFDQSLEYLKSDLSEIEKKKLSVLLEKSGYQLALSALEKSEFIRVLEIEDIIQKSGIPSGELMNLKIQAERGFPQQRLLAQLDQLPRHYGFDYEGYSVTKSIGLVPPDWRTDPTQNRLYKEYEQAIKKYPNQNDLHLNFGQFLMSIQEYDQALEQFQVITERNPQNVTALMGQGLTQFHLKQYEKAIEAFRKASEVNPQSDSALLNLAVSLEKSKQKKQARIIWKQLLERTEDDTLKQNVRKFLDRSPQE